MNNTIKRIRRSLEGCKPKLSFGLCLFEEGFDFDFFGFLVALPFMDRWAYPPHEIMESWGIKYFERSLCLTWGRKCKFIYMPWMLKHIKCEVLRPDGSWVKAVPSYSKEEPDGRQVWTFDYSYHLKSGEIQKRVAEVYVERREWRQRWLAWCPWFAVKSQSIDVSFNDEVGERSGSWKGGCVGCGYDMRPGETPEATLRRMERERTF